EGLRAPEGVGHPPAARHVRRRHRGAVMTAGAILVASVFVVGTGVTLLIFLFASRLPGHLAQRQLLTRLGELNRPDAAEHEDGDGLVKDRHQGPLPLLDRFAGGTQRGFALSRWVDQSGTKITLSGLCLVALATTAIFGFLGAVIMRMAAGWLIGGMIGF